MSINANLTEFVQAHASTPAGMAFYPTLDSVKADKRLMGYVSAVERAWYVLGLKGVLCLDGRPVLYIKEHFRQFSPAERIKLQRLFWNQGIANVLVLADPTTVYIYSGLAKPLKELPDEEALVDTLNKATYTSEIKSFYHSLAIGHYYETKRAHFNPEKSVDKYLLNNLEALRNKLIVGKEGLDIQEAHAFIGRVLFICYLLDRGIYSVKPDQTGAAAFVKELESRQKSERVSYLYKLFSDLKEKFNGNMFDHDLDAEKRRMNNDPSRLDYLVQFLGCHDVTSGQLKLDFWAYDFNMIPVETISEIYQKFLAAEDTDKQKKRGAYYTPRFLAEMVIDTAVQNNPDAYDWSYLDPACGSGIFLVIIFNRLATNWVLSNPKCRYATKATALQEILRKQIRGIDIEETSCRITCFSLYLAYLNFFEPCDINSHTEKTKKPLFTLLDYGSRSGHSKADIPIIHLADSLDEETLTMETFDCVIGNPPYEGRGSKQTAQEFMSEMPRYLKGNGIGCLLLPSKMLHNKTDIFQADWLKLVTLEKVIQLADYRHHLFSGAKTPTLIARFQNKKPGLLTHRVDFVAPKFNRDGLRQGVITINPSARTWVPLVDILAATTKREAQVMWKRYLWGTPRDQKLLDYLLSLPPLSSLADEPSKGKRWVKGEGLQPFYPDKTGKPVQNPWSLRSVFADAKTPHAVLLFKSDCTTLGEKLNSIGASIDKLRRAPNSNIFKCPMVLLSKGFEKVAYCDFDVLFQDALRSISGPIEDAELLMFLTVFLRSKLARYFLFHTSANWGTERNQVHLDEVLRVPFPLPGDEAASKEAKRIVKQVAVRMKVLRDKMIAADSKEFKLRGSDGENERKKLVDNFQEEMEQFIYEYYDLTKQERILVEDTMEIFEPSSTPSTWRSESTVTLDAVEHTIVEPYAKEGLKAYANTLVTTLNEWAKAEGSIYRVSAEGGTDGHTGLSMVTLGLADKEIEFQSKSYSRTLIKTIAKLRTHFSTKNGSLEYERDLLVNTGKQIYIIRPNILLNWTRTAALNDAAKIFGDITLSKQG